MKLELTSLEARLLGCLVEKELATPEYYPLTLNALVAACNQKNNRDPVLQLAAADVEKSLGVLQYDKKLVGTYSGASSRAVKYTHRLLETLGVDTPELALLCELLLRGPQTPGELRGRAARMHPFTSPAEVRTALDALAARPEPYVVELPRAPGCKANRFAPTFGPLPDVPVWPAPRAAAAAPSAPTPDSARIRELEQRLAELEAQIAALRRA